MRRLVHGFTTLVLLLLGKKPEVPDWIKHRRIAICYGCPNLFYERGYCNKCGCRIELKTGVADESCPIDLWGAYEVSASTTAANGSSVRPPRQEDTDEGVRVTRTAN
jgi:hypothetical protein